MRERICTLFVTNQFANLTAIDVGCKLDTSVNKNGKLETANLIAQMHSTAIIPLKFMCVDLIYDAIDEENTKTNKKLMLIGEEAEINWVHQLRDYPEEIRSLFPRKELWRWALFLKDEKKQAKILKLYQSVNRREKDPKYTAKAKTVALTYGAVKFCVSRSNTETIIWLGDFESNSPKCRMYCEEFTRSEMAFTEKYLKQDESGREVVDEILNACGWDVEDAYLFLHIIDTAFLRSVANESVNWTLFNITVQQFRNPPKWYTDFMRETYGLEHPERTRYIEHY